MENEFINILNSKLIKVMWNNKKSWIAMKVAEILAYENPSKLVNYFISSSELVEGIDYEVLAREELRLFKGNLINMGIEKYKRSPKLILFYESGLVEFLRYRNKLSYQDIRKLLDNDIKNHDVYEGQSSNNIIVKNFNGNEICTLNWNGKPCWIATDIAKVLEYKEKTVAVRQCIQVEEFENGIEYDVLYGNEVRELINARCAAHLGSRKHINNLIIFYKEGLLGFINYAHMPIGKEFRKWLRTEVFSELIDMEVGETASENKFRIKRDNLSENKTDNLDKRDNLSEALEFIKVVDRIIDENNILKVDCVNRVLKLL